MPRKPKRPAAPVSVYGTHAVGAWVWWAAWLDGRDRVALFQRPPDATGWAQAPEQWLEGVAFVYALFTKKVNSAAGMEARNWLHFHGGNGNVEVNELAVNAWHRAGCPQPPAQAPAAVAPPAPPPSPPAAPAAPVPPAPAPEWWVDVLGCGWPPTAGQVTAAYRQRVAWAHPDAPTGSTEATTRLNRAHTAAQGWLANQEEMRRHGR